MPGFIPGPTAGLVSAGFKALWYQISIYACTYQRQ